MYEARRLKRCQVSRKQTRTASWSLEAERVKDDEGNFLFHQVMSSTQTKAQQTKVHVYRNTHENVEIVDEVWQKRRKEKKTEVDI